MIKIDETASFLKNKITCFFVKPHVNPPLAQKIYEYLQKRLIDQGEFKILFRKKLRTEADFWREFYAHLKTKYPQGLEDMAIQFANEIWPMDLSYIKGDNIIQRVKDITGDTFYKDNPPHTIRGKFGPYEMPNTLVHAPKLEEVAQNIKVLNKYFYNYIPINISL